MLQKWRCFIAKSFQISLEYEIMKGQGNQVRLKLNGKHQLLVYAEDVNLVGDNIHVIK
jgi:hypothetical protein